MCSVHNIIHFDVSAVPVVGFQQSEYTFLEGSSNNEVCVTIDGFIQVPVDFAVSIATNDGTAICKLKQ